MSARPSILEDELAAYTPYQLAEFVGTISILFDSADDGSLAYCVARARIMTVFGKAAEKHMESERRAGHTATIVPFPNR